MPIAKRLTFYILLVGWLSCLEASLKSRRAHFRENKGFSIAQKESQNTIHRDYVLICEDAEEENVDIIKDPPIKKLKPQTEIKKESVITKPLSSYQSKEQKRHKKKKPYIDNDLKLLKEFQKDTFVEKKSIEITSNSNIQHEKNPFAPIEDYEYEIGIGDVLEIHVWNHPELSSQHTVGPDGVITLPVIGDFKIEKLSRSESTKKVSALYNKFYPNVIVNVKVVAYNSIIIYTLGNISSPGPVTMNRIPKLLELVSQVGGMRQGQNSYFPSCAIIRGRDAIAWIDLNSLINNSDLKLNLDLRPNDVVHFSDWNEKPLFLLGEVNRPGPQIFRPGMSILDAINNVGGLTRNANRKKIQIIRMEHGKKVAIRHDDLLAPNPEFDIKLLPGDIIMVPPNWLSKFNYVISTLNPLSWWAFSTGTATAPGVNPNTSVPR
jgi:polysaccharide export outer membrane protein